MPRTGTASLESVNCWIWAETSAPAPDRKKRQKRKKAASCRLFWSRVILTRLRSHQRPCLLSLADPCATVPVHKFMVAKRPAVSGRTKPSHAGRITPADNFSRYINELLGALRAGAAVLRCQLTCFSHSFVRDLLHQGRALEASLRRLSLFLQTPPAFYRNAGDVSV